MNRKDHNTATYECVDKDAESVPGSHASTRWRVVFYHVEASCNGLPCPPYIAEKELTCAVCKATYECVDKDAEC